MEDVNSSNFDFVHVLNPRFLSRGSGSVLLQVESGFTIPSIRSSIRPPKSTEPSEPALPSGSKSAVSSVSSARGFLYYW